MKEIPERLAIETTMYGSINGERFKLVGGGEGQPFAGVIHQVLNVNPTAVTFPMGLMDVPGVMGFPTFSRYLDGTTDLFKREPFSYEYKRRLRFQDGGVMESFHRVEYCEDRVVGDFRVEGEGIRATELGPIEPIVETFIPAGPGRIRSTFTVVYPTSDGPYTAHAKSEYTLHHDGELPGVQFRHIEFTTNHSQETHDQTERLIVFRGSESLV